MNIIRINKPQYEFIPLTAINHIEDGISFRNSMNTWDLIYRNNRSEFVFAFGWHKEGMVINALRNASGNHLCGWNEAKTTYYEQWFELGEYDEKIKGYQEACRNMYTPTGKPYLDNLKPSLIRPVKVTIVRHEGWDLDSELKRCCARFKGWHKGTRLKSIQNPSSLTLQPEELVSLPGYCLYGRLDGNQVRLLEWPTHDYHWLKYRAGIWYERGASKMTLVKDDLEFEIKSHGWINKKIDNAIARAIQLDGDNMEILDVVGMENLWSLS